jgi:hypothetical protein
MTATIDSKAVSKVIRKTVWLKLEAVGFCKFTTRTAWRFGSALHVVNFQSFNSYNAEILGCTTMSFSVNLGLHFDFMPGGGGAEYLGPDNPPKESQCIFRKPLRRSLPQPNNADPRIWSVDSDGLNVALCVADALQMIEQDGLPWFTDFSDPMRALRFVEAEEESFDQFGPSGTWGFGRPGSPMRKHAITYLRKAVSALHGAN